MKAIVHDHYGGSATLSLAEIPRPPVGDDDVLVAVAAAGVDRGALHFMTGQPYLMRPGTGLRTPRVKVPGVSFAGRVAEVGPRVTGIHVGDEVYGACRGAYAEYVAAPQGKVAPRPAQLSPGEAAVLPYAAFAAVQAVVDHGRVRPGERVLVVGGSGAVGSIAVQVARASGAEVTAVCGPLEQGSAAVIGADHLIDYTREDFADGARRYDVIIDVFGRTPIRRLRRALTPRGRLVLVGGEGDPWIGGTQRQLAAMLLSPFVRQTLRAFVANEDASTLRHVNDLVAAGKVRPVMGPSYPLAKASDAVAALESGSASGRIVVTV